MAASGNDKDVSLKEDLQFQEIGHTSINMNKEKLKSFSHEESDEEGNADNYRLLGSEKRSGAGFWTWAYYQQLFDVDTVQVGARLLAAVLPHPRRRFLQHTVRAHPDLYGPFWVCTTLVFTIAIAGNVANYIQTQGRDYHWVYDFHKVTLSAVCIYSYWWVLPALLWALLAWRGGADVSFLELLCLYGYSLAVYIPISVLWVIQVAWLQWLLVALGLLLSGSVLVLTVWPLSSNKQVSIAAIVIIILFHGLLASGFMLYFFHVPSAAEYTSVTTAVTHRV